jgi:hypothetical protein
MYFAQLIEGKALSALKAIFESPCLIVSAAAFKGRGNLLLRSASGLSS